MPDVIETIRHSRPDGEALASLDIERIARRARRRDIAGRAMVAVVAVVALAGGIATLGAVLPDRGVYVGPGESGAEGEGPATGTPAEDGEAGDTGEGPEAAPEPADLEAAIEQLIGANRQAEPRPVADEAGEVLVERTYAIWSSTTVSGGGATHELEVTWYELRTDAEGRSEVVHKRLATLEPTDDLAELREAAQPHFAAGPPEVRGEPMAFEEGQDSRSFVDPALDQAERDSHGSAEPVPGKTERPQQAQAFIGAADVLRVGLQPEDRIRALEVIGRLDPSLVEYRETVVDVLGREGIGIAGWDGVFWNVLIFDPETGDLLGEYTEFDEGADVDAPPVTSYTARETTLLRTAD